MQGKIQISILGCIVDIVISIPSIYLTFKVGQHCIGWKESIYLQQQHNPQFYNIVISEILKSFLMWDCLKV